jgi:hypothetical protein
MSCIRSRASPSASSASHRRRGSGSAIELALVVLDRLLVGQRGRRPPPGLERVGDRRLGTDEVTRLEEVVGELRRLARPRRLELPADRRVEAGPPARAELLVLGLPQQVVGERERVDLARDLRDHAHGDQLVEGLQERLGVLGEHRLEHPEAEALADHRGHREQVDGRLLERRQPPEDHLLDALGHPEGLDLAAGHRRRGGAAAEAPQHLVDEERVPARVAEQLAHERRLRLDGAVGGQQVRHLLGVEAAEGELLEAVLAPQVGEQAQQLRGRVDLAEGPDDHQPAPAQRAQDVAQERQRRLVGPVEVVDQEQHRPRRGQPPQDRRDRFEQPVAVVAGVGRGRGEPGRAHPEPRDQAPELERLGRQVGDQPLDARVVEVLAERLDERLVGRDRLLVRAPVEHRRARLVDLPGEARGDVGLAHARLAGHEHEARLGADALPVAA